MNEVEFEALLADMNAMGEVMARLKVWEKKYPGKQVDDLLTPEQKAKLKEVEKRVNAIVYG